MSSKPDRTPSAARRFWRWLTKPGPAGFWFSRPLWPHFAGAAGLIAIIVIPLVVFR